MMANNDKGRRKHHDMYTDNCEMGGETQMRYSRRGKPQQKLYEPGSGPLKKTPGSEDNREDFYPQECPSYERSNKPNFNDKPDKHKQSNYGGQSDLSEKFRHIQVTEDKRKSKKPEQARYVPKPVAKAIAERDVNTKSPGVGTDKPVVDEKDVQNFSNNNKFTNNDKPKRNEKSPRVQNRYKQDRTSNNKNYSEPTVHENRPKRYSNRRRPSDTEPQETFSREFRQTSEPRGFTVPLDRSRDTRSVEPCRGWVDEKIPSKPPTGRRNSTISVCSDTSYHEKMRSIPPNLPPRLRKKLLLEHGIPLDYPGVSDDTWDGPSMAYQGNNQFVNKSYVRHDGSQKNLNQFHNMPPNTWSHTMPLPRGRGRGRSRRVEEHVVSADTQIRPTTPLVVERQFDSRPSSHNECYPSRPHSRNEFRPQHRNDNYSRPSSRNDFYRPSSRNDNHNNQNQSRNNDYSRPCSRTEARPPSRNEKAQSPLSQQHNQTSSQLKHSYEDLSEGSKAVNLPVTTSLAIEPQILDWSEEVEMEDKVLKGNESVLRLQEQTSIQNNMQHKNQKRGRRKRNGGGKKRNRGNRSTSRSSRRDKSRENQNRPGSADRCHNQEVILSTEFKIPSMRLTEPIKPLDSFKVPQVPKEQRKGDADKNDINRQRRDSNADNRQRRDSQGERVRRDSFTDQRQRRDSDKDHNWRMDMKHDSKKCSPELELIRPQSQPQPLKSAQAPGLLVLPHNADFTKPPPIFNQNVPVNVNQSYNNYTDANYREISRECFNSNYNTTGMTLNQQPQMQMHMHPQMVQQRTLFDPSNPNKPIIVPQTSSRGPPPSLVEVQYPTHDFNTSNYVTDQFGNAKPGWYNVYSESHRLSRNPQTISQVEQADAQLNWIIHNGGIVRDWDRVMEIRSFLQKYLQTFLTTDLKFCQTENIEYFFWKILFYNLIEILKKMIEMDTDNKELYKSSILRILDDGVSYFEGLLLDLQSTYKFDLNSFLGPNVMLPPKGLGFVGLALVASQKILLFLGDLARYREQVNETTNYGLSRQWYLKAQQINPKNGRPYYQLAVLAVYARRKLDAVYYYMRSLMSSNPCHSSRERLNALFDENRKKYETGERKRRDERESRIRARLKEREGECVSGGARSGGLRRETWIHPEGGRRLHRTGPACPSSPETDDGEDLASQPSVELNKRFSISYLHVHGKLITKIGMESFQEGAIQMLREFRALLQHSPLPLTGNRLLQLTALNMFAIDNTQLKDSVEAGLRSEVQERALVVSLQMFSLILERCVTLLREQKDTPRLIVPPDVQIMLPAVKVWCDWLLCHSAVWNPPPSCSDYKVGPSADAWTRLAALVTILERLGHPRSMLAPGPREGYELIRLFEDSTLCGFTPLMYNTPEPIFTHHSEDLEVAQVVLRIQKVLFFGTEFLCGVDPPVLKSQPRDDGPPEYVSVVRENARAELDGDLTSGDSDLVLESFSDDELDTAAQPAFPASVLLNGDHSATAETRQLLRRKDELERRQRMQEHHHQHMQAILQQSSVSVQMEVRPRYLVPDTNCFIDYLPQLQVVVQATALYTLMVPLVVLNELVGLARGGKPPGQRVTYDPQHSAVVGSVARESLAFLRAKHPSVRCLTTRGTVLPSSTFTVEEDSDTDAMSNDDKILATTLSMCKHQVKEETAPGEPRRIFRDVVLLTTDRNLRVKALARDVPVRELPDFMKWAGLE